MIIKAYEKLPEEAHYIRQTVFVEEQGFREEFDTLDNTAVHAVDFIDGSPVATGRIFPAEENGAYYLGRLAVLKNFRKNGTGSKMLVFLESEAAKRGASKIILHAQIQAQPFYEKNGYIAEGEPFLEGSVPHITMMKKLRTCLHKKCVRIFEHNFVAE
ncbi:MAG: GNAT family N-acetyltransferase [Oscillospiraceae bacterium]|nr:GNAT family N-acetyltransferase [Oscillospiraceae bacterium]